MRRWRSIQSSISKRGAKASFKFANSFLAILFATALFACSGPAWAQVSPQEILNPRAKALEKTYLSQLIGYNHAIQSIRFPFRFLLRRYVGLSQKDDPAPDTRGLQFLYFHDQVILKITGDYRAAYNAALLTRNQRAAKTFQDVVVPILQILPREIPASVSCYGVGIEISYHIRNGERGFDYEGEEDLVAILSKADAFAFSKLQDKSAWQEVLNRSRVYVNQQQTGLALGERDPIPLEALGTPPEDDSDSSPAAAEETSSSVPDDRLANLNRELALVPKASAQQIERPSRAASPPAAATLFAAPQSDSTPPATRADAQSLQTRYQAQLDDLAKEDAKNMNFVSYAPPAIVLFQNRLYLQVTLRNPQAFDAQASSIYRRTARSFDLFLAPQLKALLAHIPSDPNLTGLDITVLDALGAKPDSPAEAAEFVCPIDPLRQFTDAEITNQDLINQSIVLVNGVRIALNLQQVE